MAGAIGGLVGGIFGGGGLVGGMLNNLVGNIVNDLVDKFGLDDVFQAVTNLVGDLLQTGLNSLIDSLPIPDFMKDGAKAVVADAIGGEQEEVRGEVQGAVDEELGGSFSQIIDNIMEQVKANMDEEAEKSVGTGTAGNWLMVLAKAMGEVSGEHLQTMVDSSREMASLTGEGQEKEFATVQAEMTGASQIFKLTQESISTVLKSIGEGLSSVARKQ